MNGYIAFLNGKQKLEVFANTSYEAQQKAIKLFNATGKNKFRVHVYPALIDGKQTTTVITS